MPSKDTEIEKMQAQIKAAEGIRKYKKTQHTKVLVQPAFEFYCSKGSMPKAFVEAYNKWFGNKKDINDMINETDLQGLLASKDYGDHLVKLLRSDAELFLTQVELRSLEIPQELEESLKNRLLEKKGELNGQLEALEQAGSSENEGPIPNIDLIVFRIIKTAINGIKEDIRLQKFVKSVQKKHAEKLRSDKAGIFGGFKHSRSKNGGTFMLTSFDGILNRIKNGGRRTFNTFVNEFDQGSQRRVASLLRKYRGAKKDDQKDKLKDEIRKVVLKHIDKSQTSNTKQRREQGKKTSQAFITDGSSSANESKEAGTISPVASENTKGDAGPNPNDTQSSSPGSF